METYNLYNNYGYHIKHYFVSGLSKIIDLGNIRQVDYPNYMSDAEARKFDSNELSKDFQIVGNDMRKAIDSYGKEHPIY